MNFSANPNTGSESKNLLMIKSGESIIGIFRGEPKEFWAKWENKKSVACDPCDAEAKFRFRVNFITKIGNEYKALIWEQGAQTYDLLKQLNADFPLETSIMKILRHGEGLNTSYTILPIKDYQITPEKEETLKAVELNDLTVQIKTNDQVTAPNNNPPSDELPF